MSYYEQPTFINGSDIDITSDSNMISYEQYLRETKNSVIQDTPSPAQQDTMIMSVIEEMCNQVTQCKEIDKENKIIHESLTAELERYKEQIKLFEERPKVDLNDREKYINGQLRKVIVESHKTLSTTIDVLKMESKAKEDKYLEEFIDLEKKKKALDNVVYKIESRLKMQAKQNDPIAKDEKINIMPIDYAALNKLSENFVSHFVPQKQLSVEQAFRLPISKLVSEKPPVQPEPVLKEIPRELPPISLVKDSFNKMRSHVNQFDEVIMETIRGREEKSLIYNTSFLGEYECSSLALDRGRRKVEDEIGSLETRLNYVRNSAVFIACRIQRLLRAVQTVPDISGGRPTYQGPVPFLSFSGEGDALTKGWVVINVEVIKERLVRHCWVEHDLE
ncbi:hypothetical protein Tco_0121081 [Tanacetum coccineum]